MKVKMIGTGAIYTKYASACAMIDEFILLDCGCGTLKRMLQMELKPEKINTIIITHFHGDHMGDIPYFLKYFYLNKRKEKIEIIGPKGIKQKVADLFAAYGGENEEKIKNEFGYEIIYKEIDKEEFKVGKYMIQPVIVNHGEEESAHGYIVDHILGYTGDAGLCTGVEKIIKQAQKVVLDCSLIEGKQDHMGIDNMKDLLQCFQNKILIGTHFRDDTRQVAKMENLPRFYIPEDGDEFEIEGE